MNPHSELFDIGITTNSELGNLMRGVKCSKLGLSGQMWACNGSLIHCLPYAPIERYKID